MLHAFFKLHRTAIVTPAWVDVFPTRTITGTALPVWMLPGSLHRSARHLRHFWQGSGLLTEHLNGWDIPPCAAPIGRFEQTTSSSSGVNRLRCGTNNRWCKHGVAGETGVNGGPRFSMIDRFVNAAGDTSHEDGSRAAWVHGHGPDTGWRGTDVGPRSGVLLAKKQEWRKKHTDQGCFHIFSYCFSITRRRSE
jgi:hypothetical protein